MYLVYRGIKGTIHSIKNDTVLFGRLLIPSTIGYVATSLTGLVAAFKVAVEEYIRSNNLKQKKMRNSRGYVKQILTKNKKQNTKVFESLNDATTTSSGSVAEIDWSKFSQKEISGISKMKLQYLPELSLAAQQCKTASKPVEKPIERTTTGRRAGPEAY